MEQAIETNPYGFINKPYNKATLLSSITIALTKFKAINKIELKAKENYLFVKDIDVQTKVFYSDILYIESQKNYLDIKLKETSYSYRSTIKEFITRLPNTSFIQTHRAFIINAKKVDNFSVKNKTIFINDKQIPISKSFEKQVFSLLK